MRRAFRPTRFWVIRVRGEAPELFDPLKKDSYDDFLSAGRGLASIPLRRAAGASPPAEVPPAEPQHHLLPMDEHVDQINDDLGFQGDVAPPPQRQPALPPGLGPPQMPAPVVPEARFQLRSGARGLAGAGGANEQFNVFNNVHTNGVDSKSNPIHSTLCVPVLLQVILNLSCGRLCRRKDSSTP